VSHWPSAEDVVSSPSVIASVMADAFHLPFLLSLLLHQCCPRSVQHATGLELAQEDQNGHSGFLIHRGFTWQSPVPLQGLCIALMKG